MTNGTLYAYYLNNGTLCDDNGILNDYNGTLYDYLNNGTLCDYYLYNGTLYDYSETLARFRVTVPIIAAFMLLFFIIGFPWNALILGIILRRRLFTRPSVMLMLNLAIANLLVCLLIMIPTIVTGIRAVGIKCFFCILEQIETECKSGILLVLLPLVSAYTIALMAVDRVIYLMKPLTYGRIVTPWRMFFVIFALWLFFIAISLPPLFGFGVVGFYLNFGICNIALNGPNRTINSYFILVVVFYGFAVMVQLIGCGCIIYIVRKQLLRKLHVALARVSSARGHVQRHPIQNPNGGDMNQSVLKNYNKSQLQLVKIFGCIFTAGLLTLIPLALGILVPLFTQDDLSSFIISITYISYLSRSVIYPILESYMTHEIRAVISKNFLACLRRCQPCESSRAAIHARAQAGVGSSPALPKNGGGQIEAASTPPLPETEANPEAGSTPALPGAMLIEAGSTPALPETGNEQIEAAVQIKAGITPALPETGDEQIEAAVQIEAGSKTMLIEEGITPALPETMQIKAGITPALPETGDEQIEAAVQIEAGSTPALYNTGGREAETTPKSLWYNYNYY